MLGVNPPARLTLLLALAGCDAPPSPRDAPPSPRDAPAPLPAATAAITLGRDDRARLTSIHVSAHAGAVILRKRGESWFVAGEGGCRVAPDRIERALDGLASLAGTKTEEQPADGHSFELQIMALAGEKVALELDVAGRNGAGDLVQLGDQSRVRMRGLDRALWSPRPADWCVEPRPTEAP